MSLVKAPVFTEACEEDLAAPFLNISYFFSVLISFCLHHDTRPTRPVHLNGGGGGVLSTIHLASRPMDLRGRAKKVITQRGPLTP